MLDISFHRIYRVPKMLPTTLFSRLSITLFFLLFTVGLILIELIGRSSILYQQEVSQKLSASLAEHIVDEQPLMLNQTINRSVLDELFHNLMVINPSIELYLLDTKGYVLEYSAPVGKVVRKQLNLKPIVEFIEGNARFPLKGDDPRNAQREKVFSAAKINNEKGLQGYLYIVLGSEQYDDVVQMLGDSYIINASIWVLLVALFGALFVGMAIFLLQTRRLRLLGRVIQDYAGNNKTTGLSELFPKNNITTDEIDVLGQQFNLMAEKINTQINELKKMDGMRREMVANVSHDLRTPLTTMKGYLETLLLKHKELSTEDQQQYLQTALSHSQHLGKLVEELFELAKLDSCETVSYAELFSMGELVQDVTQKYLLRAEQKSIEMLAILNPDAPLIYGDIAMMQRVLENLIENALHHTPAGGCIRLVVDVESSNLVVKVSDTGCGIDNKDVAKIFDRFYQKDENRSNKDNAGLGLSIVKRILELHGSIINVQSKIDQGTTFTFLMQRQSNC